MSRNWAFVIGINDYVNFAPLRCAKRDAEVMAAFFVEEARFDGVWLFTDDSPAQVLPNGNAISTAVKCQKPAIRTRAAPMAFMGAANFDGNCGNQPPDMRLKSPRVTSVLASSRAGLR